MGGDSALLPASGPLNQGDILIAPVARVAASDLFVPDKWDRLDQTEHEVGRSVLGEDSIHVLSGRALVMVTSHDCHHDKDWNIERGRLIRSGLDPQVAEAIAEEDPTLDRTFQASPLVPLDDLEAHSRGNYRAGRVVGFFPVPASPDGSFPECHSRSHLSLHYRQEGNHVSPLVPFTARERPPTVRNRQIRLIPNLRAGRRNRSRHRQVDHRRAHRNQYRPCYRVDP